jgi:hypothetical protein
MLGLAFFLFTALAQAQAGVIVRVEPECPYGYFDTPPFGCAPAGYYGPEWFSGEVFIGAGPWFHGHDNFRGYVDNRLHPEHGYRGEFPKRGERAEPSRRVDREHFKGNELRDGRGHLARRVN